MHQTENRIMAVEQALVASRMRQEMIRSESLARHRRSGPKDLRSRQDSRSFFLPVPSHMLVMSLFWSMYPGSEDRALLDENGYSFNLARKLVQEGGWTHQECHGRPFFQPQRSTAEADQLRFPDVRAPPMNQPPIENPLRDTASYWSGRSQHRQ